MGTMIAKDKVERREIKSQIAGEITRNARLIGDCCRGEYTSYSTSTTDKMLYESGSNNTIISSNNCQIYSSGRNTTCNMVGDMGKLIASGDGLRATLAGNWISSCISGDNAVITATADAITVLNSGRSTSMIIVGNGTEIHDVGIDTDIYVVGSSTKIEAANPVHIVLNGGICKFKLPYLSVIEIGGTIHTVGAEFRLRPGIWYCVSGTRIRKIEEGREPW